jgi:bifunctional UDP-N-acetylglucosamine pyrophosphorylase/glucosamine-1-phosphate N-acetyltransferase
MAAGEGVRMRPLTLTTPKPMIIVNGRPLLLHLLESLPEEVDELILVVGYLGQQIVDFLGNHYNGKRVSYVWQTAREGTFSALLLCRPFLKEGRFLVLYSDDLHDSVSLKKMASIPGLSILTMHHDEPKRFGVIEINPDHTIRSIVEKPENPASNLVSTGPCVLDSRIFDEKPAKHSNGELYLTVAVEGLAHRVPIHVVEAHYWIPIGYPRDISYAEKILAEKGKKE